MYDIKNVFLINPRFIQIIFNNTHKNYSVRFIVEKKIFSLLLKKKWNYFKYGFKIKPIRIFRYQTAKN